MSSGYVSLGGGIVFFLDSKGLEKGRNRISRWDREEGFRYGFIYGSFILVDNLMTYVSSRLVLEDQHSLLNVGVILLTSPAYER